MFLIAVSSPDKRTPDYWTFQETELMGFLQTRDELREDGHEPLCLVIPSFPDAREETLFDLTKGHD
jgi:hypothetical protein